MGFMKMMMTAARRMAARKTVQPKSTVEPVSMPDGDDDQDRFENEELKAATIRNISTTPTIRSTPELRAQEARQIHSMGALSDGPTQGPRMGEGTSDDANVVNMPL